MNANDKGEKACTCGLRRFTVDRFEMKSEAAWQSQQLVGLQIFEHGEAFELRNCPVCNSTLAWPIDWVAARQGRTVYLNVDYVFTEPVAEASCS